MAMTGGGAGSGPGLYVPRRSDALMRDEHAVIERKLKDQVENFGAHVAAFRHFLEEYLEPDHSRMKEGAKVSSTSNENASDKSGRASRVGTRRRENQKYGKKNQENIDPSDQNGGHDTNGSGMEVDDEYEELAQKRKRQYDFLWGRKKYCQILQEIHEKRRKFLPLHLEDLRDFIEDGEASGGGPDVSTSDEVKSRSEYIANCAGAFDGLMTNTCRYLEILYEAACQSLSGAGEASNRYESMKLRRDKIIEAKRRRILRKKRMRIGEEEPDNGEDNTTSAGDFDEGLLDEDEDEYEDGDSGDYLVNEKVDVDDVPDPWDSLREKDMASRFVPAYLRSTFQIIIVPFPDEKAARFRNVDADRIGKLSRFYANVVKVSQVRPKLQVAAFECERCHDKVFQPVEGPSFMPLVTCPSCEKKYSGGGGRIGGAGGGGSAFTSAATLKFHTKLSLFESFQEVRVEEAADEVPEGDVPRALTCLVSGYLTKRLQPGMNVELTGVLKPVQKVGFAALKAGPIQEKCFEVLHIHNNKDLKSGRRIGSDGGNRDAQTQEDIRRQVKNLRSKTGLYDLLARSIAPGVWGMDDVKKALLLQLIGGITTVKPDGGMIRGDIHIMLMGDPGLAKSQLMQQVCSVAHRAVYTTGKGSSSCGLTAAIVKDPNTNETTLEGGALVLADRGICCIDEFDKMDEYDRSAIYEVMEQQTVSIAKAGHCSSLPARAAVLAAANPKDSRYDIRKSVLENINLPAALLSRFDLQFLLLDRADREKDMKMASHVLSLYQSCGKKDSSSKKGHGPADGKTTNARNKKKKQKNGKNEVDNAGDEDEDSSVVSKEVLRAFIAESQHYKPILPNSLKPSIVDWFVGARQQELQDEKTASPPMSYTTARALLGVLRLSQALARLRRSEEIEVADFEEALRLIDASKESIMMATAQRARKRDKNSEVFSLIKRIRAKMCEKETLLTFDGYIKVRDIEQQAIAQGLTTNDVGRAMLMYEELTVLVFNKNRTKVAFLDDAGEGGDDDGASDDDSEKRES